MAYEDPIEAALRALTDVEWTRREERFEARTNKTHALGIVDTLTDHRILATADISAARSGRYITTVPESEIAKILKAVETTGAKVKPHRRKWHS